MTFDLSALSLWWLGAFAVLGCSLVCGLLLQSLAIVRQRKNFTGLFIKLGTLGALLAAIFAVRANVVPYLIVLFAAAFTALAAATLARRALLR